MGLGLGESPYTAKDEEPFLLRARQLEQRVEELRAQGRLSSTTVLHAWLTHIHSFEDGNGRCSRAITTLEYIRNSYPPIVIRKNDRARYYEALGEADRGDLAPCFDLMAERTEEALSRLTLIANAKESEQLSQQERASRFLGSAEKWSAMIRLLGAHLREIVALEQKALLLTFYASDITAEECAQLVSGVGGPGTWLFRLESGAPHTKCRAILARLVSAGPMERGAPILQLCMPNPTGFPLWRPAGPGELAFGAEAAIGDDAWIVQSPKGEASMASRQLARAMVNGLAGLPGI